MATCGARVAKDAPDSGISADKLTESAGPFWVRRVYQTLRQLGDVEGQNLIVERFSAEGLQYGRLMQNPFGALQPKS